MIVLMLALAICVPYILGTALTVIMGDRGLRGPGRWVFGSLAVFAFFYASLLIELKLHGSLSDLCRVFGVVITAVTGGSLPVFLYAFYKGYVKFVKFDVHMLPWIVPALILGVVSVCLFKRSYINDITIETVNTTLYTGKIYEYSSLLGIKMEAGLPIFNKIEIVPMFYACLCSIFGTDIRFITDIAAPIASYISNLVIMWEISAYLVKDKHRNLFMIFHLFLLLAGTYLPANAIPITVGQPLLMQGYSGYAWGYGVLIPAIVLVLLQKKYLLGGLFLIPLTGLIKLDRLFFEIRDINVNFGLMKYAGKLLILYLVSLIWWIVRLRSNHKTSLIAFLSGTAIVSTTMVDAYEFVGSKKSFVVSMMLVILACCSFTPFKDADFIWEGHRTDISVVKSERGETVLWAPESVLDDARRQDASIFPIYGRDMYNNMLRGTNYEPYSEGAYELYDMMDVLETYSDEYVESLFVPKIEDNRELDKVDVVMIPIDTVSDKIKKAIEQRGFDHTEESGRFLIMRKDD